MIDYYEIKRFNNNEVLLLYFNIDSEFASINIKEKYEDIKEYIKRFIWDNRITFNGSLALIVIGGTIIDSIMLDNNTKIDDKTLLALNSEYRELLSNDFIKENTIDVIKEDIVNNNNEENIIYEDNSKSKDTSTKQDSIMAEVKSNVQNNNVTSYSNQDNISNNTPQISEGENNEVIKEVDNNTYITIQRSNGPLTIELEEYITGVVASEMPALFHPEALKAQAIIARTYALKAISKGQILSDTNSTQNYEDESQLKSIWGSNYNTYYNKVRDAVNSTKGMYLTHNGTYIEAVYHSTSNGKTEDSSNAWGNYFPYLISVSSEYDNLNPSFMVSTNYSYDKLSTLLGIEVNSDTEFTVIDKTIGDRVKTISVNDKIYTGVNFRNILGLRSADFSIEKDDTGIIITTKGYGHGVGMSQYGANGMAKNGYSYVQILNHYYPGTDLNY